MIPVHTGQVTATQQLECTVYCIAVLELTDVIVQILSSKRC